MDLLQNLTFIVEIFTIGLISIVAFLYCIAIFHPIRDVLSTYVRNMLQFWLGKSEAKGLWQGINRPVQMTVLAFLIYFVGVLVNSFAYDFTLFRYRQFMSNVYNESPKLDESSRDISGITMKTEKILSDFKANCTSAFVGSHDLSLSTANLDTGYYRHFEDLQKFRINHLEASNRSTDHILRFIRIERASIFISTWLVRFSCFKLGLFLLVIVSGLCYYFISRKFYSYLKEIKLLFLPPKCPVELSESKASKVQGEQKDNNTDIWERITSLSFVPKYLLDFLIMPQNAKYNRGPWTVFGANLIIFFFSVTAYHYASNAYKITVHEYGITIKTSAKMIDKKQEGTTEETITEEVITDQSTRMQIQIKTTTVKQLDR